MIRKEVLVSQNLNLVKNIAYRYKDYKMGIEYEDLVGYGIIALLDAIDKFDDSKGVKFSTYASLRIKSYLIDEIRYQSPLPRACISNIKLYLRCEEYLQQKYLRVPEVNEIAEYMGISINEINKIKISMLNLNIICLDNNILDRDVDLKLIDTIKDRTINLEDYIEKNELTENLTKALEMLNERDKLVLYLYYYEEQTLKEIGEVLKISVARVSQLKKKAILNLKNIMKKLNYLL